MGFRFRKSAKVGPFRINFSKSGVGYSFGGKGFRVTKKAGGGMRTTASIPGTGVSYVKDYGSGKKSSSAKSSGNAPVGDTQPTGKKPIYQRPWFVVLVIILLLGAVGSACGSDDASQTDTQDTQMEETVVPEEDASTQEETQEQQSEPVNQETPDSQETATENEPTVSEEAQPQDPPAQPEAPSEEDNTQQQDTPAVAPVTPPASTQETQPAVQPEPDPAPQTNEQKTGYVGSTDSDKYHSPGCRWVKKILPENEIWFESKEAAEAAGYSPCGTCQ